MIVKEIYAKTILSKSKVMDYTINPYVGCEHKCAYCYARFMKRFTGHAEEWGEFVDVKVGAPTLLLREIKRKRRGMVWISGTCDPYQPLEKKYELTRRCLEILAEFDWPVTIQTKSPLVLRDIDLIRKFSEIEVGFSIGTGDDVVRRIFEPRTAPIGERIEALARLHRAGIKTFAMIAPLLPGAEGLPQKLSGKVDSVLIDRSNYHNADRLYIKHGLEDALEDEFFDRMKRELRAKFKAAKIPCRVLF